MSSHVSHIAARHRSEALIWLLVVVAFTLGFLANFERRATVVTRTRVTHPSVAQLLGKPDQSVDGAQIGLAGDTCDVYQAKRVVYCHP